MIPPPDELAWLAHSPDLSVLLDADGTLRRITASIERLFGHSEDAILGTSMLEWLHPEDVERVAITFLRACDSPGVQVPMLCRLRHADGSWVRVEAITVNALDEPDVAGMVSSIRIVDLRHEGDQALERIAKGHALQDTLGVLGTLAERIVPMSAAVLVVTGEDGNATGFIGGGRGARLVADLDRHAASFSPFDHGLDHAVRLSELADPTAGLDSSGAAAALFAKLQRLGFVSCWSAPLDPASERLGWLGLVSTEDDRPGFGEREQLERVLTLAGLAAYRARLQDRLDYQAWHDGLTGLPNRMALLQRLEARLTIGRRETGHLAVLFADLDRFKTINDRYGHAAGDMLLAQVAGRLRAALDDHDLLSRFGGDEFVVACSDLSDVQDTVAVAETIIAALNRTFFVGEEPVDLGVSIGIAVAEGAERTASELLQDADAAMYEAKRSGSNRWALHPSAARAVLALGSPPPRAGRSA